MGNPRGHLAARVAFAVGLLYAVVSLYWALGGTWLLDTVGAPFDQKGGAGSLVLVVWVAVVLKLIGAVLPLLALRRLPWRRLVRVLAWVEAVVLTLYGLVWTLGGVLAEAGVAGSASHAQAWHAALWDPWFLVWGLLVTVALLRSRRA
jgi:uncharacterized protein DUF3995